MWASLQPRGDLEALQCRKPKINPETRWKNTHQHEPTMPQCCVPVQNRFCCIAYEAVRRNEINSDRNSAENSEHSMSSPFIESREPLHKKMTASVRWARASSQVGLDSRETDHQVRLQHIFARIQFPCCATVRFHHLPEGGGGGLIGFFGFPRGWSGCILFFNAPLWRTSEYAVPSRDGTYRKLTHHRHWTSCGYSCGH